MPTFRNLFGRAPGVVTENARVRDAVAALRRGDLGALGRQPIG